VVEVNGSYVREKLTHLGPNRLFAIVTEPPRPAATTLFCLTAANEYRIGPGRLWVNIAREAAKAGIRTIRFDRRLVGDSVHEDDADDPASFTPESVEDLIDVVQSTVPDVGRQAAFVGLCSGAWVAAKAAAAIGPRAVFLVNQSQWRVQLPPRVSAVRMGKAPAPPAQPFVSRSTRIRQTLKNVLPYHLTMFLGRRGYIKQVPGILLGAALSHGTTVRILLGDKDTERFESVRGRQMVRKLRRRGDIALVADTAIEHALLTEESRARVTEEVLRVLKPDADEHPSGEAR
jgi:hypothetical protein